MRLIINTTANKIVDSSNNKLKIGAIYTNLLKYSYIERSNALDIYIYIYWVGEKENVEKSGKASIISMLSGLVAAGILALLLYTH